MNGRIVSLLIILLAAGLSTASASAAQPEGATYNIFDLGAPGEYASPASISPLFS